MRVTGECEVHKLRKCAWYSYLFVISTSVIDCLEIHHSFIHHSFIFVYDILCVEWDVKPCSTQLNSANLHGILALGGVGHPLATPIVRYCTVFLCFLLMRLATNDNETRLSRRLTV